MVSLSVLVNGKKVAGTGPAGLSPYQVAVAGGYTGTEQEFNQQLAQLDQLFTSVSEGKSTIAAAVTDKGVETAADATFQQMAENIGAIESGGIETVTGSYSGNMRGSAHLAWSDGETFHYLEVGSSSRTMVVMKNSIAILRNQNFASFTVSGGAEYIGYSGGYFITGDFSVAAQ